jgi:hypothetical protein
VLACAELQKDFQTAYSQTPRLADNCNPPLCLCVYKQILVGQDFTVFRSMFSRRWVTRLRSSGMWRHVGTYLENCFLDRYQHFGLNLSLYIQPWRWRQYVSPMRWYLSIKLHCATSKKTVIWSINLLKKYSSKIISLWIFVVCVFWHMTLH